MNDVEHRDVIVAGGGLAGLVAATTAAREGASVVLLDAHDLGGRARVDERNGFAFNRGPRALYVDGAAARVLEGLGVRTDRGGPPAIDRAQVVFEGRLHVAPQGPLSLLRTRLLTAREKVAVAGTIARLPRLDLTPFAGASADDAIAELRLPPVGAELLRAFVRLSTYSAATDQHDAVTALGQLQLAMTTGVRYLDGGWQSLVDDLARQAQAAGVAIRTGATVRSIDATTPGRVLVEVDGDTLATQTVVIATGTPDAAAHLLGRPVAAPDRLGPPALAACLELGLRRDPRIPYVLGVDQPTYLSTHSPPADLAPEGGAVVHVMRYLRADDDTPPAAARAALADLAARVGIASDDVVEERFLARMTVTGAIPTASGGGLAGRTPVADPDRPDVLVAGDWVGDEGLLADAAVASGAHAGRLAAARSGRLAVA